MSPEKQRVAIAAVESPLIDYVSDPNNDGSYVLHLDEKQTRKLWDEVDAMAEQLKALKSQGKAICEALEYVLPACYAMADPDGVDAIRGILANARVVFPK